IFTKPFNLLYKKLYPEKFASKIGVNFELGKVKIYGNVNWSTEPWIITIGKHVHITDNVTFITHDGGTLLFRDKEPKLEITKPIVIGNNVYIGNNVILLPGVNVGDNVLIGAGSVVTKSIENNSVYAGNPARKIKSFEEYHIKITNESLNLGHLKGKEKDIALQK